MKTNIYLYLILISLLIGGFTGFIGYDHFQKAERTQRLIESRKTEIEKLQGSLEEREKELLTLSFTRREKQTLAREFARDIDEQRKVQQEYIKLEEKLRNSIRRQEMKFLVNQEGVSELQDQLSEDMSAVERQLETMRTTFDIDRQRLKSRQEFLASEDQKDARTQAKRMSELDTRIDEANFELQRVSNLSPTEIEEPWIVGEVIDFNAPLNQVIINLGATSGIKQNFRFRIFTTLTGQDRDYKGLVIIKNVDPLISTGVMQMNERDSLDPVAGDSIGSMVFRKEPLTFYLAGDFREKYSKEQIAEYLRYHGNHISPQLDANVDIFVQGALADNEIPIATSLGVAIIPQSLITPYLGE